MAEEQRARRIIVTPTHLVIRQSRYSLQMGELANTLAAFCCFSSYNPPMLINSITVAGFKSFGNPVEIPLSNLNVLIGANGAGKSNFVDIFQLLSKIAQKRLQEHVAKQGGPDVFLHGTRKKTDHLYIVIGFAADAEHEVRFYGVLLEANADNKLIPAVEGVRSIEHSTPTENLFSSGHLESGLLDKEDEISQQAAKAMRSWRQYHFHDTGPDSPIKRMHGSNDNLLLKPNGDNLAAYLMFLRANHAQAYNEIVRTIQLAAPFFGGFVVRDSLPEYVELEWFHRDDPDTPYKAHLLSDGTLRFMCLATLLLQPYNLQPSTILIDEPELGLHPYAIHLLGEMLHEASTNNQVIISTQSSELLNLFAPENILVAEREEGGTTINRLDETALKSWLEEYSLAELWKSNVLGGRPTR